MRGFRKDKDRPYIITRRNAVYEAHKMYVDGYETFTTHDIMDRTSVGINHVSAIIARCEKSGLMAKTGKKTDGRNVYRLTKEGIDRGQFYVKNHYNELTEKLEIEVEQ